MNELIDINVHCWNELQNITSLGEMNFEPHGVASEHTFAPDPNFPQITE
jgi:hypothetical protein